MDLFFLWMCIFSRGTITTSNSVVIVWLLCGYCMVQRAILQDCLANPNPSMLQRMGYTHKKTSDDLNS